jgi:hypothetical protein
VVQALEFAELDRIDDEADVPLTGEPRPVVLVVGLGAVADAVLLHVGVTADVQDRGRPARQIFRHVEIGCRVEPGERLEVHVFNVELVLVHAPGHGGLEIGLGRQRREPEHFQQLFAIGRSAGGPIGKRPDVGKRALRDARRLLLEVACGHAIRGRFGGGGGDEQEGDEGRVCEAVPAFPGSAAALGRID